MLNSKIIAAAMVCAAFSAVSIRPAVAQSNTPAKGSNYVALGSSFAAGPGIASQAASCGRSDHNYPHLVAAALGLKLTDVSCSGSTTANILDTPQGEAPPQLAAVTSDTALVTVTIGGNDITYSASTGRCGGARAEDKCAARLDQAGIAALVRQLPARLAATLDAIRAKAPRAVIVLVPYPRVVPVKSQRCDELGLAADDADYFATMGQQLEDAFISVANSKQVLLADPYVASDGHGPCAAADQRWVNGAKPAGPGASFHPTAVGHEQMAKLVLAVLGK